MSFGETGRLNYAWFVNHLEPAWQGWEGEGNHGTPEHPPRVLVQHPRVLEFASPVPGTYPLWFDPAYWYAGAQTRFDVRQQWHTFTGNLTQCKPMIGLLAGALALCGLLAWRRKSVALVESSVYLVVWPVAACLLYALVHVESRYFAGFLVIFWLTIPGLFPVRWRVQATAVLLLVASAVLVLSAIRGPRNDVSIAAAADARLVAGRLKSMGVRPGDRLAVVGDGFYAFYARLSGTRIVAEIPDANDWWRADCRQAETLRQTLGGIGVKALVATGRPKAYQCPGWQEVPGTRAPSYSLLTVASP